MNKKLLNILPAPVIVGTIQLGIGGLYTSLLWLLRIRPSPKLTPKGNEIATKVGIYHGSGQLLSMVSLGAGPVSFTHIVKALEPFFSAMISGLVFGKWMKIQVYATLIPVVGGVGYACLKERSFSWLAFWMAMSRNLSFALRAVASKTGMTSYINENMNAVNLFAVGSGIGISGVLLYSLTKQYYEALEKKELEAAKQKKGRGRRQRGSA